MQALIDRTLAAVGTSPLDLAPRRFGRVVACDGGLIEVSGLGVPIGTLCSIAQGASTEHRAETIGFRNGHTMMMMLGDTVLLRPGAIVRPEGNPGMLSVGEQYLGRAVDGAGEPIDGRGPVMATTSWPAGGHRVGALDRSRVTQVFDSGIRSLNALTTFGVGQRVGIVAGSGVGKSVLMDMIVDGADADAVVVGLIGERGREVREFIEETLGEEGLRRAIVVVATSDEPALKRRQAAYMTLAIAEFMRDQDMEVLCLMDSVTRFAMAQREIGLAAGEPPTTKGYTPTVFTELPKLLERAGPGPIRPDGTRAGPITGLFTVLVDGDDHNEPIADAVRGILDGHIVMERAIAERGRFPAINVLKSISRTMPGCHQPHERQIVTAARQALSAYANMEELIRIGAYRPGSDPQVDQAIALNPALEGFLSQDQDEATTLEESFGALAHILEGVAA